MSARVYSILILACVLAYSPSLGQTSQPASKDVPQAWQQLITDLSKSLTDDADETAASNAVNAVLADDVVIQKFGSADAESRFHIRPLTTGLTVVSAHAYVWPMDQFAADLAADVRASNSMPDDLRRQFIPKDDAATKRANMTSQQWVGALLHPENDQFVGVIVLCVSASTSEVKPPVFVLIKGKKIEDDQFRVTQLVFGDARQALN